MNTIAMTTLADTLHQSVNLYLRWLYCQEQQQKKQQFCNGFTEAGKMLSTSWTTIVGRTLLFLNFLQIEPHGRHKRG